MYNATLIAVKGKIVARHEDGFTYILFTKKGFVRAFSNNWLNTDLLYCRDNSFSKNIRKFITDENEHMWHKAA